MNRKRLAVAVDETRRLVLLLAGALISAAGFSLFQVPYNIAAGGVSGIAILINHFTGWPVSTLYLLMNVPLFVLGFFYLGRWRFFFSTALVVVIFSFATGWFNQNLPLLQTVNGVTNTVVYPSKTPAYTIVDLDARIGLEWAGLNETTYIQLNVTNLFDKLYVGGFDGQLADNSVPFVQIGAPRAFIGSIIVGL